MFKGIDIDIVQYPPPQLVDLSSTIHHWNRNDGKAITVYLLPQPMQMDTMVKGCLALWNHYTKLFHLASQEDSIVSIGSDTMTIARRIAADAFLESLQAKDPSRKQLLQVEWGTPGNYIRTVYTTAQNQSESTNSLAQKVRKNYIFTHHLTERRVGEKIVTDASGSPVMDMEGLHNTYRFLDIALRMEKKVVESTDSFGKKTKEMGIVGSFKKCGYDISLEMGGTIENPTWDSLATLINKNLDADYRIDLRGEVK